jgi:hypothetical protein
MRCFGFHLRYFVFSWGISVFTSGISFLAEVFWFSPHLRYFIFSWGISVSNSGISFLAEVFRFPTQLFTPPDFLCPYNQFVRFSKTKKRRRKKRRKRGTQTGGYLVCGCVTQDAQGCAPAATCSPLLCFSFAPLPLLHLCTFQQLWLHVWHYHSTLHYCLIVLILPLSAAYPKLHIVLRRAEFVSPGNRSSNLSPVLPVGCSSPLCA